MLYLWNIETNSKIMKIILNDNPLLIASEEERTFEIKIERTFEDFSEEGLKEPWGLNMDILQKFII